MAREEGMSWYAVSELEDVLGFVNTPRWLRGPHYSASLHLAGRHSQGGVELFALHCPNGQYAVLALQESRPLPGFDFLGDVASARALTEEFLAIQRGQPIRLVGNVDFHDGFEQISPDDLLAEPLPSSRLRSLRSWRALRRGLLVGVLVVAGAWGGHYLLEYRRQETLIQLQGSPAYQQQLYREGLRNAWATLPPAADEVLVAWADLLARLPLHVQGWQLSHIECELGQCRAYWLRRQGSHADFLAHMPTEEGEIDEVAADQDPMAGSIVTLHTLDIPADGEALTRQTLPNLRLARRTLADLLQDLQLLGMSEARVDPPQLFGGTQDKELLNDAVFSGPWSLRQALWVLPSLSLPDFVRVQTLKVDVLGKSRSTSASADSNALVARSGGAKRLRPNLGLKSREHIMLKSKTLELCLRLIYPLVLTQTALAAPEGQQTLGELIGAIKAQREAELFPASTAAPVPAPKGLRPADVREQPPKLWSMTGMNGRFIAVLVVDGKVFSLGSDTLPAQVGSWRVHHIDDAAVSMSQQGRSLRLSAPHGASTAQGFANALAAQQSLHQTLSSPLSSAWTDTAGTVQGGVGGAPAPELAARLPVPIGVPASEGGRK
jgi:hypothetical protein